MQPPPMSNEPGVPAPNGKRTWSTGAVVAIVIGVCGCAGFALLGIGGAILFPVFAQAKKAAQKTARLTDMKQSGIAMLLYSGDHDDRLPAADNWRRRIAPYDKRDRRPEPSAMNAKLSRKTLADMEEPEFTVMLFGSAVDGTAGGRELVTFKEEFSAVAYADGHAKMERSADGLRFDP